jgi:hypothetical protein
MPASNSATPAKNSAEHRQQPLAHGLRPYQLRLRADVADAEFGPRARHFAAQDRRERQRVRTGRAHDEGRVAHRLQCAFGVD